MKKIKQFIREEWKFLLFILLLYFGLTYEFPYLIYAPGGEINMSERIDGDHIYDEEGRISLAYVRIIRSSLPFLAMAKVIPEWDIEPREDYSYDGMDFNETMEIDKIYMQEAISNAEFVAYSESGISFNETGRHLIITLVSEESKSNLKYGDEILKVDGIEINSLKEFQDHIAYASIGDKITLEYKRKSDDKIVEEEVELVDIDGYAKVGISMALVSDYETAFNITVKSKESESGPSGGLMTALAVYNRITEEDITKGRKIMGTGTIERDGTVGVIGGVKYKLLGAENKGAEIFLCPEDNYQEAIKVKEEHNLKIEVINVSTFQEAIRALRK